MKAIVLHVIQMTIVYEFQINVVVISFIMMTIIILNANHVIILGKFYVNISLKAKRVITFW